MTSLRFFATAVRSSSKLANGFIGTLLVCCGTLSDAAFASGVSGIRSGDHGDYQRVVFDLQGRSGNRARQPTLTRIDALHYEVRFPDTNWQVEAVQLGNADLVHSLQRLPPTKANELRVQLTLTAAAELSSRSLSHPARLLVDLRTTSNARQIVTPTRPTTPVKAPPPTASTRKALRVIIDPGHGGRAPGAVGPNGVLEKAVVLAICKQLKSQLNARPGITAFLTRDGDATLSLQERVDIARDRQADLFVSVHADAIKERSVRGGSVYVLSNVGANKTARRWAGRLDHIPQEERNLAGIDLNNRDATVANVLFDLVQTDTIQRSNQLASDVLTRLSADNEVRFKKVRLAELGVLKAPDIPSILVETAFISNPSDERLLNSSRGQKRLANSIAQGIEHFANRATEIARARSRLEQKSYQDYAVSSGDTLFSLARRFGTTVKAIRKANALPNDQLRAGMTLKIPTIARRVASRS